MYTSDTEFSKTAAKTAFAYLVIALICVLFGAVYELFSHEVYSYFMLYAFSFPLAGGTFPFLLLSMVKLKRYPGYIARNLHHSAIATLTMGSFIQGVLEIYGTTNTLIECYWFVGILLLLGGILTYFFPKCNAEVV